ncbi:MAG TPA: putative toxin-antitoxin system toxin component, PIN family [Candidatus Anammoximicrobium sp.]|nr:putative toxin-antitoxin system toxin component, PIN family [Candidatus Anammoximicrobium sp.]
MKTYQVVLDTNVLVAAARSKRGASYALLRTLPKRTWQMCISPALLLEYESQLKIEAMRQNRPLGIVDRFLDYLLSVSNRRQVYFLLRPFLPDANDDFVIELAVAAQVQFIVTHNVRDFAGAEEYGVRVLTPLEFLRMVERES